MIRKIKYWLESKWLSFKTGSHVEIANDGNPVEEIVIHYKDIYFSILIDAADGDPTGNFGWTRDGTIYHVPVRDFYTAERDH